MTTQTNQEIFNQGLKMNGLTPENIITTSGNNVTAWNGITTEQVTQLINWVSGKQESMSGDFHSWCRHKKSGKIFDVYNNPETKLGNMVQQIMLLHNCDELIYEEFDKTPKYLERMLSDCNFMWNKDWFKNYKMAQDYSGAGYCFQRAHLKHKSSKTWKIKFGKVYIKNSRTGNRYCIEGEGDDVIVNRHIDLVQNRFMRGLMTEQTAFNLITFFMSHSHQLIKGVIASWRRTRHSVSKYSNQRRNAGQPKKDNSSNSRY